ncbi:MAG: hypothetical protein JXR44_05785 [Thiotrichales bacterium]|nr:hypothetical protein [Thiotrichales bacterium]
MLKHGVAEFLFEGSAAENVIHLADQQMHQLKQKYNQHYPKLSQCH